jgi:hypothetical protein
VRIALLLAALNDLAILAADVRQRIYQRGHKREGLLHSGGRMWERAQRKGCIIIIVKSTVWLKVKWS